MTWTLVEILSVTAALLVLLMLVWPALREVLFDTGTKGECQFSLTVSSLSSLAGTEIGSCPTEKVKIGNAEINRYLPLAERQVNEYHKNPSQEIAQQYPLNPTGYKQWAMDKIVADQLVDCWEKVVFGKFLPKKWTNVLKEDVICVICSTINFQKDLPFEITTAVQDKNWINKINEPGNPSLKPGFLMPWLKNNYYQGQTYFDYIMRPMKPFPFDDNPSYDTEKRQAVVFWAINPDIHAQVAGKIFGWIPGTEKVQDAGILKQTEQNIQLFLWPYEDITAEHRGGLGCQKIIG